MKEYTLSTWLLYKIAALFLVSLSVGFIYFVIYLGSLYEVLSLIRRPNIMMFERQSVALIGGIPMCIYLFFFSLRALFTKGLVPPKKQTTVGFCFMLFSLAVFVISYIAMWIIPFVLMASPYTPCHEKILHRYYVIDPQLCKTITPQYWPSYNDK